MRRAISFPYVEVRNSTATVEHEASTSKIGVDQIFYCNQRGITTQDAVNMIVNGVLARKYSITCPWSSPSKRKSFSG